nr:auxin response factor 2-like isoform X1 [Ipomoea batatas]
MRFLGEEAPEQRYVTYVSIVEGDVSFLRINSRPVTNIMSVMWWHRFTRTIVGIEDRDPHKWPESKWRCLKRLLTLSQSLGILFGLAWVGPLPIFSFMLMATGLLEYMHFSTSVLACMHASGSFWIQLTIWNLRAEDSSAGFCNVTSFLQFRFEVIDHQKKRFDYIFEL